MNPNDPPAPAVREAVARALAEDLTPLGDLTSALLPAGADGTAALVARRRGVLAGRACVDETWSQLDPLVGVQWLVDDGDELSPGMELARAKGPLASLLTGERTALNFLCHLSGVATLTRSFVDAMAAQAGERRCQVLDTRKTLPGLRALEKAAVRAGGGFNHRGNLSEFVLLKDNHVGAGIAQLVREARRRWPARTVEVECDRLDQVVEAVEAGATMVLLDNMTPGQVAECVHLVAGRALVEVSGGVTLDTVAGYAVAGPDYISTSSITQSAPALDIGLDLLAPDLVELEG